MNGSPAQQAITLIGTPELAAQNIYFPYTIPTSSGPTANSPNPAVYPTAEATSGLPVTYTSRTPAVCTASGNNGGLITLVGLGTCTINVTQAGNATYAPAPPVTESFSVVQGQVITFAPIANNVFPAGSTFQISATSSAGLPVTFMTLTPVTCSISGTTVTFIYSGGCLIQASAPANSQYPAATATQAFVISNP